MILRISRSLSGAGAGSARAMPATTTLLSVSLRGVSPASSSPQDRRGARQSGMKPTDRRRHRSAQPRRARAMRRASPDPPPRVLGLADQVWLHPVGMGEPAHRTTRSRPQPTSARPRHRRIRLHRQPRRLHLRPGQPGHLLDFLDAHDLPTISLVNEHEFSGQRSGRGTRRRSRRSPPTETHPLSPTARRRRTPMRGPQGRPRLPS